MAIFAVACLILSLAVAAVNWRRGEDARSSLRSYAALALLLVGTWVMLFESIQGNPRYPMAHSIHCISISKQLGIAALMYSGDWDERMPVANLRSSLKKYLKNDAWACPLHPKEVGYAFNGYLKGASFAEVSDPEQRLLLAEADRSVEWITRDSEIVLGHEGKGNVVFADCHVKTVRADSHARWTEKKVVNFALANGREFKSGLPWASYRRDASEVLFLGSVATCIVATLANRDPARRRVWMCCGIAWAISFLLSVMLYPAL